MIVSLVVRIRGDVDDGRVAGVVEAVDDGSQIVVRNEHELLAAIHSVVYRNRGVESRQRRRVHDASGKVETD